VQRHFQGIVQPAVDLNAFALDGQRVPDADGDVSTQRERVHELAVDHFVKAQVVPQRAGAYDVKVRRILETEHNTRHLLRDTADDFELRCEFEIIERFAVVNEHGEPVVSRVLVQLREHRAARGDRRPVGERRERRWHLVLDDFPFARWATAGQYVVKAGRHLACRKSAEINLDLRTVDWSREAQPKTKNEASHRRELNKNGAGDKPRRMLVAPVARRTGFMALIAC